GARCRSIALQHAAGRRLQRSAARSRAPHAGPRLALARVLAERPLRLLAHLDDRVVELVELGRLRLGRGLVGASRGGDPERETGCEQPSPHDGFFLPFSPSPPTYTIPPNTNSIS